MNARSTIAATIVVAALAAPVTAEARTLPVGTHNGVAVKVTKKATVVRFGTRAAALYRTVAGRNVGLACSVLGQSPIGLRVTFVRRGTVRAAKQRRTISARFGYKGADVCTVTRARTVTKRHGKITVNRAKIIARVPLTQRGATFVSETEAVAPLKSMVQLAVRYAQVRRQYPTFGQITSIPGASIARYRPVALSSAEASPPRGATGYYSDGASATVARVASTGRRMFITVTADGQLSSNGIVYLTYYT